MEVYRDQLQLDFSRIGAGEEQQPIDERGKAVALLAQGSERLAVLVSSRWWPRVISMAARIAATGLRSS